MGLEGDHSDGSGKTEWLSRYPVSEYRPGCGRWKADEDWRGLLPSLARLKAAAALASEAVRDGLVAGTALREAAGWLAHRGAGAWGIAGHGSAPDGVPLDDRLVGHSLLLARHWRELADSETTLAGGEGDPGRDGLRRALAALGRGGITMLAAAE